MELRTEWAPERLTLRAQSHTAKLRQGPQENPALPPEGLSRDHTEADFPDFLTDTQKNTNDTSS